MYTDHISFQIKCGEPVITDHNVDKTCQEEAITLLQILLRLLPKESFLLVLLTYLNCCMDNTFRDHVFTCICYTDC